MKKLVALLLVVLAVAAFAGTAAAKARGDIIWNLTGNGNGNAYGHSK